MDVSGIQLPPGDNGLIDKIVSQLKSQGIFDQFRKECIADVDTKPAYQNLRQRVEGSVSGFLATQKWKPDLNKNQMRESLRKHVHESGFLDIGIERVVDQVVNPKIYTVFLPQVEDVVYTFLGINKPNKGNEAPKEPDHIIEEAKTNTSEQKSTVQKKPLTLADLLPADLDPVSPERLESDDDFDDFNNGDPERDQIEDEEETSPPFEKLDEAAESSHHEDTFGDSTMDSSSSSVSSDDGKESMPMVFDIPDRALEKTRRDILKDIDGVDEGGDRPTDKEKLEDKTFEKKEDEKEIEDNQYAREGDNSRDADLKSEKKEEKLKEDVKKIEKREDEKKLEKAKDEKSKGKSDEKQDLERKHERREEERRVEKSKEDARKSEKVKDEDRKHDKVKDERSRGRSESEKREERKYDKKEEDRKVERSKEDARKNDKFKNEDRNHDKGKDKSEKRDGERRHERKEEERRSEKSKEDLKKCDKIRDEDRKSEKVRDEKSKERRENRLKSTDSRDSKERNSDSKRDGNSEERRKHDKDKYRSGKDKSLKSEKDKSRSEKNEKSDRERSKSDKHEKERKHEDEKRRSESSKSSERHRRDSERDSHSTDRKKLESPKHSKHKDDGKKTPSKHRDDKASGKSSSQQKSDKDKKSDKEKSKDKQKSDDHRNERDRKHDDRRSDRDKEYQDGDKSRSDYHSNKDTKSSSSSHKHDKKDGRSKSEGSSEKPKDSEGVHTADYSKEKRKKDGSGRSSCSPANGTNTENAVHDAADCSSSGDASKMYDSTINSAGNLVLKIKKPKIASNIHEVKKIMQQRKNLERLEQMRRESSLLRKSSDVHEDSSRCSKPDDEYVDLEDEAAHHKSDEATMKDAAKPPEVTREKLGMVESDIREEVFASLSVKGPLKVNSGAEPPTNERSDSEDEDCYYLDDFYGILPYFVSYVRKLEDCDSLSDVSASSVDTDDLSEYEDVLSLDDVELTSANKRAISYLGGNIEAKSINSRPLGEPVSPTNKCKREEEDRLMAAVGLQRTPPKQSHLTPLSVNAQEARVSLMSRFGASLPKGCNVSNETSSNYYGSHSTDFAQIVPNENACSSFPHNMSSSDIQDSDLSHSIQPIAVVTITDDEDSNSNKPHPDHQVMEHNPLPTPENENSREHDDECSKQNAGEEKKRGRGRPRKLINTPPVPENFIMPLSPESDVSSVSGDTGKRVPLLTKENQSGPLRHQGKVQMNDKLPSTNNVIFPVDTENLSEQVVGGHHMTPSSRLQRYSSDDLYKPRPLFTKGSRRDRTRTLAENTNESFHPNSTDPSCVKKRRNSDIASNDLDVQAKKRR